MNSIAITVLAAAALAARSMAPGPPAQEVEALARTSAWDIRYDEDSCTLLVQFGKGDDSVFASFTRYEPGDDFDLTLYGKRFSAGADRFQGTIDFGTGPHKTGGFGGANGKMPLVMFDPVRFDGWSPKSPDEISPAIAAEQEEAIVGATFSIPRQRSFRLEFGSLGKPFAALRACEADLLKHWGYDPDAQSKLSRKLKPAGKPETWIESDDFPSEAMRLGVDGLVKFRLDVDEQGTVSGCHVLFHTNLDAFATTTCATIGKRARFHPALNQHGAPIRSFFISKVHFQVPG